MHSVSNGRTVPKFPLHIDLLDFYFGLTEVDQASVRQPASRHSWTGRKCHVIGGVGGGKTNFVPPNADTGRCQGKRRNVGDHFEFRSPVLVTPARMRTQVRRLPAFRLPEPL